jgi:hypothetical protein
LIWGHLAWILTNRGGKSSDGAQRGNCGAGWKQLRVSQSLERSAHVPPGSRPNRSRVPAVSLVLKSHRCVPLERCAVARGKTPRLSRHPTHRAIVDRCHL